MNQIFDVILALIEHHPVFQNNSNNPQAPVREQLAVCLYRMGRYGNGASLGDIARMAGISEGSVVNYSNHCIEAIMSLHEIFVRKLTDEEKEVEKTWMDNHLGFTGSHWRDGWLMYDGTIVVLYAKPDLNGDAYYTRKCNYGLNLQVTLISHSSSNLLIVLVHRSEMCHQICASSTFLGAEQDLLMIPPHSMIPARFEIPTSSLARVSSHGLTLHIPSITVPFQSTKNLLPSILATLSSTSLWRAFVFAQSTASVFSRGGFSVCVVYVSQSGATRTTLRHVTGCPQPSFFTTW